MEAMNRLSQNCRRGRAARVRGWAALALSALPALAGGTPALAQDAATAIVIVDGSGSMWGRLDNDRRSKFVLTTEGLRRALRSADPATRIGLAAFGHRRGGDCGDIQQVLEPQKLDVERVMAGLERVNPRGRGPLVQALRETARSLAGVAGGRTIVLVHDDPDNCQQDACAAAAEIARADPALTVNVVSLGMKREDVQRMACVATATHGRAVDVHTAEELTAALTQSLASPPRPAAAPVASAAPAPVAVQPRLPIITALPPPTGAPALHLAARLGTSAVQIPVALDWSVALEGAAQPPVFAERAANPVVPAAAGRYLVIARDGRAEGRRVIDFDGRAPVRVTIDFDAGLLRLGANATDQAAHAPGASVLIRQAGEAGAAAGPVVAILPAASANVLLPPGRFVIDSRQGLQRLTREVTIVRGEVSEADAPRATARLALTALAQEGGRPLDDALFLIFEDDPDATTGRREIARSARLQPEFSLPAGTYYAVARHKGVEVRERLALATGESVRRNMTLNVGRLALTTRLLGASQPVADDVSYRIERLDVVPVEVRRATGAATELPLSAGRYRIEAHAGLGNARAVEEFELKAGDTRQLRIELKAASVTLRLKDRAGTGGAINWRIVDADGRTVLSTLEEAPRVTLQAGRYTAQVEVRERRGERPFEVRAGQTLVLEAGL